MLAAQQGGACTTGVVAAGIFNSATSDGNNLVCVGSVWQYPAYVAQTASASANASCATYPAGAVRYNTSITNLEYCDATNWQAFAGAAAAGLPPTVSNGVGYFVMSQTKYDGNLGGQISADATCLTELTTNTGWMGYSAANTAGQLVASKVGIWLVSSAFQKGLTPLTKYYYASAGDSTAGGAYFYTNGNGYGPYTNLSGATIDTYQWNALNRFGGNYIYWAGGRQSNGCSTDDFANTYGYACSGGAPDDCGGGFSSNSASITGAVGDTSATGFFRFNDNGGINTCDGTRNIICYVNP